MVKSRGVPFTDWIAPVGISVSSTGVKPSEYEFHMLYGIQKSAQLRLAQDTQAGEAEQNLDEAVVERIFVTLDLMIDLDLERRQERAHNAEVAMLPGGYDFAR